MVNIYKSKLIHTAYFDRSKGLFTLQSFNSDTEEMQTQFTRLPALSGQKDYQNTSWSTGKSPIPLSSEVKEDYRLWLDNQYQENIWPWQDKNKIGEFWHISTGDDKRFIYSKDGAKVRNAIGLHVDNEYPGSAGCIVLVANTETQKLNILLLREYLKAIQKFENLPFIKLVIF